MGKKSTVWDPFKKDTSSKVNNVTCCHCSKIIPTWGNTTNMYSHLKNHHRKLYLMLKGDINVASRSSITKSIEEGNNSSTVVDDQAASCNTHSMKTVNGK